MFDMNDPAAMDFARSVFESAKANQPLLGLPCNHVCIAQTIHNADFVYALWPDTSKPNGVGLLIVKELDRGTDGFARCQTIPCIDEAAALRLQATYNGRPSRLN
jgi:hypothetical protein